MTAYYHLPSVLFHFTRNYFLPFRIPLVELAHLTRQDDKTCIHILTNDEVDQLLKEHDAEEKRIEAEKQKAEKEKQKAAKK